MPQNYWSVICPETEAPGLWQIWLNEKCVAIGWPPSRYHIEGPPDTPGWDIARARAQLVCAGDIVIPYLLRFRFGIPGEVVRVAISDASWKPTVVKGGYRSDPEEPQLGRRIEVKWLDQGMPPFDKIIVVPPAQRPVAINQTIVKLNSERSTRFMGIIRNPDNWKAYERLRKEEGSDDDAELSVEGSEPDADKLAIQETLIRSILAKNLQRIEPGLKQHPDFTRLEEVTFELGRLDLLCVDSNERPTIIELQLGSLNDGHIGKVCRYYGWFAAKYGGNVRAMLLFENASHEVLDAYKKALPWLELRKFALTADIKMEPSWNVK